MTRWLWAIVLLILTLVLAYEGHLHGGLRIGYVNVVLAAEPQSSLPPGANPPNPRVYRDDPRPGVIPHPPSKPAPGTRLDGSTESGNSHPHSKPGPGVRLDGSKSSDAHPQFKPAPGTRLDGSKPGTNPNAHFKPAPGTRLDGSKPGTDSHARSKPQDPREYRDDPRPNKKPHSSKGAHI